MDDNGASGSTARTIQIDVGSGEVVTIDLDDLDLNVDDLLEVIKDSRCNPWVWTTLALEYWKKGNDKAAETIAQTAVETTQGSVDSLPIHALLANIQMSRARKAPKIIMSDAQQDDMRREKPKDHLYKEAAVHLNKSTSNEADKRTSLLSFLTRGIHQLATRSIDDAYRSFEFVLAAQPTNLVALLGKARVHYVRRQYKEALKLFQYVLQLNPRCTPDPRVGIGLCFWALEHKAKAKAAWERSMEVNPDSWAAALLLGLEAINASKDEAGHPSEAERTSLYVRGTKFVEKAFKADNRAAAASNALCEVFLRKQAFDRALKLAERTIQYADTLSLLTEGHIRAARVCHAKGDIASAVRHYTAATKEPHPKTVLASIGLAQMHVKQDEYAAAIHTLDTFLAAPSPPNALEAVAMLASLRAYARPGISAADLAADEGRARELYGRVYKALGGAPRRVADDVDMHAEAARLWQGTDLEATERALRAALARSERDPRLVNNLGVLRHLEGAREEARGMYERALTSGGVLTGEAGEAMATTVLYNLARCYEEQGEAELAGEAYRKLLSRHPEYVDAKVRQAQMLADLNEKNAAHELLKAALSASGSDLNLRAFYTHFLVGADMHKIAKEFVFVTLKDHDKHDAHALCAAAHIHYHQARELRDASARGIEERRRGFQRAAGFYENALAADPMCAVAAQGLAIITAEDALGTLGGAMPLPHGAPPPDQLKRMNDLRDALDIFGKVKETLYDGSVYMNIGHCHYSRDEFDRAIESYEIASTRFYRNQDVPALLCLCRSHYAKAVKDQSFDVMSKALRYAQKALNLQPSDKAILYNIAMIEQKAVEMLFALPPHKRKLADLEKAIAQAVHAQKLFASLVADPSPVVPYSKDLADQRRKYGDSVLRRGEEHLATQRQHDEKINAEKEKNVLARQQKEALRDAERRKREEEEAARREEARELTRKNREEWMQMSAGLKMESDEEREKKQKRSQKRVKAEGVSGDEGGAGEQPKKKKRTKTRKAAAAGSGSEDEGLFSGDEENADRPPRKRQRSKKVIKDEDEEGGEVEPVVTKGRKIIKSKEIIEDSDEDMD